MTKKEWAKLSPRAKMQYRAAVNDPKCTCDNVEARGHHTRTCKAWNPVRRVRNTYRSGFHIN